MDDNPIENTHATQNWDELPVELWTEILLQVPPRFVFPLGYLCRSIHAAISLRSFALRHFPHHNTVLCSKEEHGYVREERFVSPLEYLCRNLRDAISDPSFPRHNTALCSKEEQGYVREDSDEEGIEEEEGSEEEYWYNDYGFDPANETITRILLIEDHTYMGLLKGETLAYVDTPNPDSKSTRAFKLPMLLIDSFITEAVGNVNGLLLLHRFKSIKEKWHNSSTLTIWNPLTHCVYLVPYAGLSAYIKGARQVEVGFGYDHTNDDYKIVVFIFKPEFTPETPPEYAGAAKDGAVVEIFSLRTKTWSYRRALAADDFCLGPKIYFNGELHWVVGYVFVDDGDDDDYLDDFGKGQFHHLMSHNLGTGLFTFRSLPSGIQSGHNIVPTVYEDSVCVINVALYEIRVWRLDQEENKWYNVTAYSYLNNEFYDFLQRNRIRSAILMVSEYCETVLFNVQHGSEAKRTGAEIFIYFFFNSDDTTTHLRNVIFMDAFVESLLSPEYPFAPTVIDDAE